ncbi:MAG: SH3 domain-containing protein, partial [Lysobacteraceae bacterium]
MKKIFSLLVPLCLAASLNAMAGEAYVAADTSLLAGPDQQYPSIVELPAGVPVQVQGCVDGWTWCDVIAGGDRGWVPGTFLVEDFENR